MKFINIADNNMTAELLDNDMLLLSPQGTLIHKDNLYYKHWKLIEESYLLKDLIGKNIAIHCSNLSEYNTILDITKKLYRDEQNFDYDSFNCLCFKHGFIQTADRYWYNTLNYKIIPAQDFINANQPKLNCIILEFKYNELPDWILKYNENTNMYISNLKYEYSLKDMLYGEVSVDSNHYSIHAIQVNDIIYRVGNNVSLYNKIYIIDKFHIKDNNILVSFENKGNSRIEMYNVESLQPITKSFTLNNLKNLNITKNNPDIITLLINDLK